MQVGPLVLLVAVGLRESELLVGIASFLLFALTLNKLFPMLFPKSS